MSFLAAHVQDVQTRLCSATLRDIWPADRSITLDTALTTVLGSSSYNPERLSTFTSSTSRWRHAIRTSWRQRTMMTSYSRRWPTTKITVMCTPRCVSCRLKVTLKVKVEFKVGLIVKVTTRWRFVPETDENSGFTRPCQTQSVWDFHPLFLTIQPSTFCSNTSVISSTFLFLSHFVSLQT